jgi:hypothetical protein|tara:strand:+ start:177 stop:545 length:369 start_codon:yes stop_codon:yes gene_type:complete
MALDFSFFKDAFEGAKSIGRGAVDFFRSPSMDAARDIGSGVASIASAFREATSDVDKSAPVGLVNPSMNLAQYKMSGTSRSRAGVSSFGDIPEASFYKYAQLQNTVRYLYTQKSRYKSLTKG